MTALRALTGSIWACVLLAACADNSEPAHARGAAAAQKNAEAAALNARWTALAAALPADAAAIQARIDALRNPSGKPGLARADLDAARTAFNGNAAVWSKGQAAFATGNMSEAVAIGERLESRYAALAASLQMQLPSSGTPVTAP